MAIRTIDDIYIDGKNRAWGGYIYSLSYNPSFGEAPSELSVEVINESGVYDIDVSDLKMMGAPTVIKIGTKITVYAYPVEFNIEESPSGKTLRVDYVDESVFHLDKKVVKLKTRGLSTESYPGTIVIGTERARNLAVTENVASALFTDTSVSNSDFNVTESGATLSNNMEVADVDYTFPELLSKISSIISAVPTLDASANAFRKDYSGKLREVLSAWCNELGLGFYWENRKLNFVDLRNPANITAVRSYVDNIKALNNIQSSSYGYSLRDTYTKGVEVFFGKDGELLQDTPNSNDGKTTYNFTNIKLKESMDNLFEQMRFGETEAVFNTRVQYAYYGAPAFLLNMALDKSTNPLITNIVKVENADTTLRDAVTNNTKFYTTRSDYDWKKITMTTAGTGVEQMFERYSAYANFYGRFFWKKLPTLERARSIFGQEGRFYAEGILLKNVDIFKQYLEPLSQFIDQYETITLRKFIEGTDAPPNPSGLDIPEEGYLIMEINPIWNPAKTAESFDTDKYAIIEGDDNDTNFYVNVVEGTNTLKKPVFYFGIYNKAEKKNGVTIKFPSQNPVSFESQQYGGLSINEGGYTEKIQYTTYAAPEIENVNYYEFSSDILSEEQVLGASAFYYKNLALTKTAFDSAANDLVLSKKTTQKDPFFTSTLTVSNIDLNGVSASLGAGLVSLSISVGADGVKSVYRFGNEKMKVRSSDVFYRYYYDSAKKKIEKREFPNIYIRRGAARRVY